MGQYSRAIHDLIVEVIGVAGQLTPESLEIFTGYIGSMLRNYDDTARRDLNYDQVLEERDPALEYVAPLLDSIYSMFKAQQIQIENNQDNGIPAGAINNNHPRTLNHELFANCSAIVSADIELEAPRTPSEVLNNYLTNLPEIANDQLKIVPMLITKLVRELYRQCGLTSNVLALQTSIDSFECSAAKLQLQNLPPCDELETLLRQCVDRAKQLFPQFEFVINRSFFHGNSLMCTPSLLGYCADTGELLPVICGNSPLRY